MQLKLVYIENGGSVSEDMRRLLEVLGVDERRVLVIHTRIVTTDPSGAKQSFIVETRAEARARRMIERAFGAEGVR